MKRPLATVCLLFLILQGILLNLRGGQSLVEVPASSIFLQEEGSYVQLTGQVYDKRTTENTQILFLKDKSNTNQKLIVYDSNFTKISIGQTICLEGTVQHFDTARNEGNFNQALYYAKDHIYGSIYCESVKAIDGKESILKERLYQIKIAWKEMLIQTMGEEKGNILSAMLLGEKSEMDAEIKELYQKNGIGHILAISGLHISFIGLGFYKIIRKTGMPFWLSGVIAISGLSLYAMMIGFSVSVFRAFVMLLIRIGADVTGRVYDMMTALMLSAAFAVVKQPLYLTDAGFYLSYGAILGILLILPFLKKKKIPCASGLAVNLALFPIQLWYYFEFPLYSIFLNMLVIPLMSVLLGAGMAGSLLAVLYEPAGQMILKICQWILTFYEWISNAGIRLPYARVVAGKPEMWEMALYYIVLGVMIRGLCRQKKITAMLMLISIVCLVGKPYGELQVTMLDVGQGDCIFIQGPKGQKYLIDGGSSDVKDVGKYRIEPYLKCQGAGSIDYVFVSHGDGDHISGIQELIARQRMGVKIKNLVLPANYQSSEELIMLAKQAKSNGISVVVIQEGQCMREKKLQIRCVQSEKELSGNEGSMVLEIEYGEFQMLCTGDVEGIGEKELISKMNGRKADVLKVAHHGSKNSSEESFLRTINPRIALISAGEDNSYGHPHKETIERLKRSGCKILSTMECGGITLKTKGDSIDIFTTSI